MSDCLMDTRTDTRKGDQSEVGSQWLDGLAGRGTPMIVPLGYVNVTVGKLSIP